MTMTITRRTLASLGTLALLTGCGTESRQLPSAVNVGRVNASATQASQGDDGFLLVGNLTIGGTTNGILRYAASTGAFVDAFVPVGRGGLRGSCCMVLGPDRNLYVTSGGGTVPERGIFRFNGTTGSSWTCSCRAEAAGWYAHWSRCSGPTGTCM